MIKNIRASSILIPSLIGILLSVLLVYADFTPPPGSPPSCPLSDLACSTPLNVSSVGQTKAGGLAVASDLGVPIGFAVLNGNVGIGTSDPGTSKLKVVGNVEWTGILTGSGTVPWPRLSAFPGACSTDGSGNQQFVTALGGTLTCATPAGGGGGGGGGGGVGGTGPINVVAKWVGNSNIGPSSIFDNGSVGIGLDLSKGDLPTQKLDVHGYVKGTGLCIGLDCRTSWPGGSGTYSATISVTGWYRIAQNGQVFVGSMEGDRAAGKFVVTALTGDPRISSSVTFHAAYSNGKNPTLTLLHDTHNVLDSVGDPIKKIRLVSKGDFEGAAVDIYVIVAAPVSIKFTLSDNESSPGWTPVSWSPNAFVQVGHTVTQLDLDTTDPVFATASNAVNNAFYVKRDGSLFTKGDLSIGGASYSTYGVKDNVAFLRYPNGNGLAIQNTNGETIMQMWNNGNIGIGARAANPSGILHIGRGLATGPEIRMDEPNAALRIGTNSIGGDNFIQSGTELRWGSTAPLRFTGMFGSPHHMVISGAGNVGIGSDFGATGVLPQEKLQVAGKVRADDFCLNSDLSKCLSTGAGGGTTPYYFAVSNSGNLYYKTGDTGSWSKVPGGEIISAVGVSAAKDSADNIIVVVRGGDGKIYRKILDVNGNWSSWKGVSDDDKAFPGVPAVVTR